VELVELCFNLIQTLVKDFKKDLRLKAIKNKAEMERQDSKVYD
jgi:hypothetical protein